MEFTPFILGKKFAEVCQKKENQIALQVHISGDNFYRYSYRDLWEASMRVANWLVSRDIKKQERIAVILDNSFEWVIIYFGIMLCGGVAVPLDQQMSKETLFTLLADSESRVAFTAEKLKPVFNLISGGLPSLKNVVLVAADNNTSRSFLSDEGYFSFQDIMRKELVKGGSFPAIELDEAASILYTSGTTAVAKGTELTHRNFSANFLSIRELKFCSETDNFISLLPFFHAYAFMGTLIFPLFLGGRLTIPANLKSEEILECMRSCGVTIMIGVPELFCNLHRAIKEKIDKLPAVKKFLLSRAVATTASLRDILKINLSRLILTDVHSRFGNQLRYLVSGGARLEPKVANDLEDWGFTILEGYGLTETSPIVTFNPPEKVKIGSVGRAVPGVEIKISNSDKDGIGEVIIRGQNVMKGYYNLPEETRKVMRGGWFYSGDLGYLDKEGCLYLTGRSKEVIVLSSGKNIYPDEIEAHYSQSRFIKEICIEGVVQDAAVILKAVIVPDFEYFEKMNLGDIRGKTKWDLENYSKGLSTYKRIMGFVITRDPLPRTRLGKIKRYEVREKFREELLGEKIEHREYAPSAEEVSILESETGSKIVSYLTRALHLKHNPHLSDHLELDLGIDSLSRVDLIVGLEEMFKISLPDTFLAEISSVKDLISGVEEVIYQKSVGTPEDKTLPWKDILSRLPKKEILGKIDLKPGIGNKFMTGLVTRFLFAVFKLFFGFRIEGRQFIPKDGPCIFCCNHASYLDAFAVLAAVPYKTGLNLYFIGAREIFHHASVRWAIKLARLIAIDPAVELLTAMEVSGFLLRQGKMLCIFPEGQRSIDGEVGEFKKGAGILVEELKVPIIPVAVKGSYQAWGRAVKFPRPAPIKIIFGRPIDYKEFTPTPVPTVNIGTGSEFRPPQERRNPEQEKVMGVKPRSFTKVPTDTTIDNYSFITGRIRSEIIRLLNYK